MSDTPSRQATMTLEEKLKRLAELQAEHYPLMVSQIWGWMRSFRYDPAVIERALQEAVRNEAAFIRERLNQPESPAHAD